MIKNSHHTQKTMFMAPSKVVNGKTNQLQCLEEFKKKYPFPVLGKIENTSVSMQFLIDEASEELLRQPKSSWKATATYQCNNMEVFFVDESLLTKEQLKEFELLPKRKTKTPFVYVLGTDAILRLPVERTQKVEVAEYKPD